jgi:hypothetical protein
VARAGVKYLIYQKPTFGYFERGFDARAQGTSERCTGCADNPRKSVIRNG